MDEEIRGDESSDKVILLPWYSSPTNRGQEFGSGYDEAEEITETESNDKVILLPWYSSPTNQSREFCLGYEEGENRDNESSDREILLLGYSSAINGSQEFGSSYDLLPWNSSPTNPCQEFGSFYDEGEEIMVRELISDNMILLPWYSCPTNRSHEYGSGYEEKFSQPWNSSPTCCQTNCSGYEEGSTSASPPSNWISLFVGMGFPEKIVKKTMKESGEGNMELVLETLLTYSELKKSPSVCEPDSCDLPSESENDTFDDLSDPDSCLENEEDDEYLPDKDKKLLHLIEMGFLEDEASSAIDASGPDTTILELMDFIYAAQTAKTADTPLQETYQPIYDDDEMGPIDYHFYPPTVNTRKKLSEAEERWKRKKESWRRREQVVKQKRIFVHEDDTTVHIPKHMIGFGVPNDPRPSFQFPRKLPEAAMGPPYFYYENVAGTPKGVWTTISRFLCEIQPEFVDSLHFCSSARKRGYVHNLPIHNRYPLQPIPPLTIQEALPTTKKWWPSWDRRRKLNCLSTRIASAKLTNKIRDALDGWDGVPPVETQKYVLYECRKWNLVWTGKNKVAPLEPDEIEMILGYPKDHTRGGGVNRTDRYNGLGNSFQVDTVAYHLSVLKKMFPNGMNVLSLFSGIGGAEVALHRLGIELKNVVSVEISEVNRNIIRSWWEQTNQKGNLIELEDVQQVTPDQIEHLMHSLGGFDLIVGGSPCNNLTGHNRVSRDGLQGEHSVLFYDYFRILNLVKCIMENNR